MRTVVPDGAIRDAMHPRSSGDCFRTVNASRFATGLLAADVNAYAVTATRRRDRSRIRAFRRHLDHPAPERNREHEHDRYIQSPNQLLARPDESGTRRTSLRVAMARWGWQHRDHVERGDLWRS